MKTKLSILGVGLLSAVAVNACVIWPEDDHDDHYVEPDPYIEPTVYTTIDADHVLDTDLGLGAGLFVEYGTGGRWTLWTSTSRNSYRIRKPRWPAAGPTR